VLKDNGLRFGDGAKMMSDSNVLFSAPWLLEVDFGKDYRGVKKKKQEEEAKQKQEQQKDGGKVIMLPETLETALKVTFSVFVWFCHLF
jgi:hypothetical protein